MTTLRIIGVDPGETTGITIIQQTKPLSTSFDILYVDDIGWEERFALMELISHYRPHPDQPDISGLVVCEQFRLYPGAGAGQEHINSYFPSVRVIGYIECWLHHLMWTDALILQPASVRKGVEILPVHVDQLKGYHHARDAYKHARYRLVAAMHQL